MRGWSFPSRCFGPTDGMNDAGLQWFKDEPIRALAREMCQNSLDAVKNREYPVKVEFKLHNVSYALPGSREFERIIGKCESFWADKPSKKKDIFLEKAKKTISASKMSVLQVSDYNTIGLDGAFEDGITIWKSLVQGNGITMKNSEDSAGSFGIGKAAPFVNSLIQTVFYRTLDEKGVRAAQGVAQLMSFEDDSYGDADPVRRSIGYYGEKDSNMPLQSIEELDNLAGMRRESGTDVFIMGFNADSSKNEWYAAVVLEILENFFMSIINEKLVVEVGNIEINKESVYGIIARFCKSDKGVNCFKKVFTQDSSIEINKEFHGGNLKLTLLYGSNLNNNILVTRSSGMKISEITGLPKGFSYTGILEIQGPKLNVFFKGMEDPQHRRWDVKRHDNPEKAKEYKNELETWVKSTIMDNSDSQLGESTDVIIIDEFLNGMYESETDDAEKRENLIDEVKRMEITVVETKKVEKKEKRPSLQQTAGKTESSGTLVGYRTPTQEKNGNNKAGRNGSEDPTGNDKVHKNMRMISSRSRVINSGNRFSLKVTAESYISEGRIDVNAIGENGKDSKLFVKSATANGKELKCEDGSIYISELNPNEKLNVTFELEDGDNFGMRVSVYGN